MRFLIPLLVSVGSALAVLGLAQTVDSPAPFKAGVAQEVITPKGHLLMAGYASRKKPAEGKVQDLFVKALALEDVGGRKFVFVTTDLIGILPSLRSRIEEQAGREFQLPPECLLLNASHTHSGPEYRIEKGREGGEGLHRVFGGSVDQGHWCGDQGSEASGCVVESLEVWICHESAVANQDGDSEQSEPGGSCGS